MEAGLKSLQIRLCVIADQAMLLKQRQAGETVLYSSVSSQLERIAKVAGVIGGENPGPIISGLVGSINQITEIGFEESSNVSGKIDKTLAHIYGSVIRMFECFEEEHSQQGDYDIRESPEMTSYKLRGILLN